LRKTADLYIPLNSPAIMGNWDKVWAWQPKPALYHKKKD